MGYCPSLAVTHWHIGVGYAVRQCVRALLGTSLVDSGVRAALLTALRKEDDDMMTGMQCVPCLPATICNLVDQHTKLLPSTNAVFTKSCDASRMPSPITQLGAAPQRIVSAEKPGV
jgi:hypothetical protein